MQASRYSDLIEKAIEAAQALKPNQALFFPHEVVVARSNAGTLRLGGVWGDWRRGDGAAMLREWLENALDWTQNGYFAGNLARELRNGYCFRPVPVIDVGRRSFRPDRAAMGLPA